MKFLHIADVHLDSALTGLRRAGAVPEHVTKDCTRRALASAIDLAITEDVAFVIIAGDLYDGDWKDYSTGLHVAHEMRRLARPCFVVRGNHDAASVITRNLTAPPNVHIFSESRAETALLKEFGVALHGWSFPNRAVPEDLSASYPAPVPGMLNIGVLHTSAEDPGEHQTYAPCSIAALVAHGYDYWALGHIHQRRVLHERPFIVFPGNIQGRHPNEPGAKGVTLVEVQDGRIVSLQHRDTDVLRWAQVAVDATGADSVAEIAARFAAPLAEAMAGAAGRPLIVRALLEGATRCHPALVAQPDALEAELRNAAAAVSGDLYIERLRVQTRLPAGAHSDALDAVAQLQGSFLAGLDDPAVLQELLEDFSALARLVPHLNGIRPPELPLDEAALRALAPEAWDIVAQALAGGGA